MGRLAVLSREAAPGVIADQHAPNENATGPLRPWSRAGSTRIELLQATRIEEGEAFPAPDVFLTLIPARHCGRRE